MLNENLTTIPGLDDRHRAVLAERLGITTYFDLIMTDRRTITSAFGRKPYKPTLDDVAKWHDAARARRAAEPLPNDWQQAASFVVVFEHRDLDDSQDRRIFVQQTEIEPDTPPLELRGWDGAVAWRWMLQRLDPDEAASGAALPVAHELATPVRERSVTDRPHLRIQHAVLAGHGTHSDIIVNGELSDEQVVTLTSPGRLTVSVTTPVPHGTIASLRLSVSGGETHQIPVVLGNDTTAVDIDLGDVPHGTYEPTLSLWTPDGSMHPTVLRLPPLQILAS